MYLDYAVARNGGGPASEDVLRKHIRNSDGRTLQANGIDKNEIDSLFISERDQQPFVVIYGVGIRQISGDSKTVVAYEKTGQNGKRLVAFDNTKVAHLDEAGLKALTEKAAESRKE